MSVTRKGQQKQGTSQAPTARLGAPRARAAAGGARGRVPRGHGAGAARWVLHQHAVTLPGQRAPSHSQALVLLTSRWSFLLGGIQRTRSRATTSVPCLSSPPLQPLKPQRFESSACTAGCCLYKARRHAIYYARGDHPFSGQKSR